jgi:hypothetical protein
LLDPAPPRDDNALAKVAEEEASPGGGFITSDSGAPRLEEFPATYNNNTKSEQCSQMD